MWYQQQDDVSKLKRQVQHITHTYRAAIAVAPATYQFAVKFVVTDQQDREPASAVECLGLMWRSNGGRWSSCGFPDRKLHGMQVGLSYRKGDFAASGQALWHNHMHMEI
jgi:hypothetical protein